MARSVRFPTSSNPVVACLWICFGGIVDCTNHAGAGGGIVGRVDQNEAAGSAAVAVEIGEQGTAGFDDQVADVVEGELRGGVLGEMFDVDAGAELGDGARGRSGWCA